jgi:hypothetical protein
MPAWLVAGAGELRPTWGCGDRVRLSMLPSCRALRDAAPDRLACDDVAANNEGAQGCARRLSIQNRVRVVLVRVVDPRTLP